jgi:hypothetical protein
MFDWKKKAGRITAFWISASFTAVKGTIRKIQMVKKARYPIGWNIRGLDIDGIRTEDSGHRT